MRTYISDCAKIPLADDSVDLVLSSPPYEKGARKYVGLDFQLRGEEWVEWAVPRYLECLRVSRGLVAWVVGGRTRNGRWSAVPALLAADLHRQGVRLRNPLYYQRMGTPGSGGKEWFRNDIELIVCASKGPLPWSDPTAFGTPPKANPTAETRRRRVSKITREAAHDAGRWGNSRARRMRQRDGIGRQPSAPNRGNPGNIIALGRADAWGMGSRYAMQTEAPFPEWLARFFVLSCCRPGGIVLDPMCGSGTVGVVAAREGRRAIVGDIRSSQVSLATERAMDEEMACNVLSQPKPGPSRSASTSRPSRRQRPIQMSSSTSA